MAGGAGQGGMQHPRQLRLRETPARQRPRRLVLRAIAQADGGKRAQHGLSIVGAHAQAEPHVGQLDLEVQRLIVRRHAAHQHVAAAAGVLGQRVGRNIHAKARAIQIKRVEGQPGAPGVVERADHATLAAQPHLRDQVGEFHRHRAGGFQPHQFRLRRDARGQVRHVHRGVILVRYAEGGQLALGQRLVGAVGVVGDQHLVAGFQKRQCHVGNRRQTARHQHALQATFQRGDALFQREGGRRAVQAVGVAVLVLPVA